MTVNFWIKNSITNNHPASNGKPPKQRDWLSIAITVIIGLATIVVNLVIA